MSQKPNHIEAHLTGFGLLTIILVGLTIFGIGRYVGQHSFDSEAYACWKQNIKIYDELQTYQKFFYCEFSNDHRLCK